MNFRLADYGEVFSTRPRGREVREALRESLSPHESVSISFQSVVKVSQSFSDEFLGALITEIGRDRVCIEGDMAPSVKRVLDRALRRRGLAGIDELMAVAA